MLEVNTTPTINLGNDTVICENEIITLNAENPGSVYSWSTGENTQFINVSDSGIYWVEVNNGCKSSDTILVSQIFGFDLGQDKALCSQAILIKSNTEADSYLWSTGETTQSIFVNSEGLYWLETLRENCIFRDSISVERNSGLKLFIPNSFTPNGDGLNEQFKPAGSKQTNYKMIIFNKWGQVLFKTTEINEGWNGTCHGKPVNEDIYIWYISYESSCSDKPVTRGGSLFLYR